METTDLFWMIPAYIGGGLLTVYMMACDGGLDQAEDRPPDDLAVALSFLFWPVLAALFTLCFGLIAVFELPLRVSQKGHKKYQQKMLMKNRLKKLMAEEERKKQEALRQLEEEMGEKKPLTLQQTIVNRAAERGYKEFIELWEETTALPDATPVLVRRRQDGSRFLMTSGTIRSLKANGSFDVFYCEEYPATEEVKS